MFFPVFPRFFWPAAAGLDGAVFLEMLAGLPAKTILNKKAKVRGVISLKFMGGLGVCLYKELFAVCAAGMQSRLHVGIVL